jgi:geranyl-CoA carboxylase alpha subunit
MGQAALKLVHAARYVGAGTVEFLLEPNEQFHFLEVNTRLQVEHPVTESITGLDLVEWQLRIAQGEALPLAQGDIHTHGHAIEARLCAEDAYAGFAPQSGAIHHWQVPRLPGVRVDHGLGATAQVPPHYDSMVAKLIAHGRTREEARVRLVAALRGTTVLGVTTNRDYLMQCLQAEPFATAQLHTGWLAYSAAQWPMPSTPPAWWAVLAALLLHQQAAAHGPLARFTSVAVRETHWKLASAQTEQAVRLRVSHRAAMQVSVGEHTFQVEIVRAHGPQAQVLLDGIQHTVHWQAQGAAGWLDGLGCSAAFENLTEVHAHEGDSAVSGELVSRMHGLVVKLNVAVGQAVKQGELLLALEAMKMEHRIEAPHAGRVAALGVGLGMQVATGQWLVRIE